MRIECLVLAATLLLGRPDIAVAQPKVTLKIPSELSTYTRQTGVGTNNHRVKVSRFPVPSDRIEKLVAEPAARGAAACPDGYEVLIEGGSSRDFIGTTNSRIDGVGLYISLPDSGVSSQGNWYVAPVVILRVTIRDAQGKDLSQQPITEYDRIPVRESSFQDFITIESDELERAIREYAMQRIERATRALADKYCR